MTNCQGQQADSSGCPLGSHDMLPHDIADSGVLSAQIGAERPGVPHFKPRIVNLTGTCVCQALCGQGQVAVERQRAVSSAVWWSGDTVQPTARSCLQKDSLNLPLSYAE
jgi:hypothetical protein